MTDDTAPDLPESLQPIAADRTHGSTVIYLAAVEALTELGRRRENSADDFTAWTRALADAHPNLVSMAYLARFLEEYRQSGGRSILSCLRELKHEAQRYTTKVQATLRHSLPAKLEIAVHSHSRLVREAIAGLARNRRVRAVYCGESEPGGEGREMADDLRALSLKVNLVSNDDLLEMLPRLDVLLLGADAYRRDAFLNKIGSAALCHRAATAGRLPVHVLAQPFKKVPADWEPRGELAERFEWVQRTGRICHFS